MVASVTHTNQMQSVYGKDPWQMQRPASISASYGGTSYWGTGAYGYDSAGNVRAMGNDYYVYDVLGRLTQGTSERVSPSTYKQQNQTYDLYGNVTNFQTIVNGSVTNRPVYVSSSTNRLLYSNYDGNGNLTFDGTETYGWDPMNMMISRQSGSRDILYLYTADDERIWTYDLIANRSDYTIRDLDKKVLRVFDENWGSWSWKKDFVHRGTTLLGSSSPAGAYHYTVDHLGTPRYITNAWRQQIGRHAYYPFGEESTNPAQNDEFRKFTGHERDKGSPAALDYLDYMHARYYRPVQGRFLSVDPHEFWRGDMKSTDDREQALIYLRKPQSWNRYGYVVNNPVNLADPTGETWRESFQLFRDWALGAGSEQRVFVPPSNQVADLQGAPEVNRAREFFMKKNAGNIANDKPLDAVTNFRGKFGLVGLAKARTNSTQQFVGSYSVDIRPVQNGMVRFTVTNTTSFKSLAYGVAPDWQRRSYPTPGGNMTQVYTWTEPIR